METQSPLQLARKTIGLVLAGGRGSRLAHLTDRRAKPAVYFGGKFRIIDFALSNCLNSGVRRIGVVTQYKSHSLLRHLQRGWSFLRNEFNEFIDLLPAQQRMDEQSWYRGTADAVYQNMDILRGYTQQIIEEAFPAHREDRIIVKGVEWMDRLQAKLFEFEPATEAQKALHGETIAAYNRVLQARRQRIHAVGSGLPIVVWWALLPGAMGCLVLSLFVPVEDKRHHIVLSACLAGFVAMVLFIIIALDRPFRGAMAITPASYQLVHDQLMAPRK